MNTLLINVPEQNTMLGEDRFIRLSLMLSGDLDMSELVPGLERVKP